MTVVPSRRENVSTHRGLYCDMASIPAESGLLKQGSTPF